MQAKLWPIIFHVCWAAASTLLPLLAHNLTVNDGTAPLWQQLLGIWGAGAGGVAGVFGALVAHHKVTGQKAAQLPSSAMPASTEDRTRLCDLMWANAGVEATDAEIKAIKTLRGEP